MAKRPPSTGGLEFLSEVFWDKDGNEVEPDDPSVATGSVTVRHPDGSIEHMQVVNGANMPQSIEDMPEPKEVIVGGGKKSAPKAAKRTIRRRTS
jgi:hypothetical protein